MVTAYSLLTKRQICSTAFGELWPPSSEVGLIVLRRRRQASRRLEGWLAPAIGWLTVALFADAKSGRGC
jgi:hypothetical protein